MKVSIIKPLDKKLVTRKFPKEAIERFLNYIEVLDEDSDPDFIFEARDIDDHAYDNGWLQEDIYFYHSDSNGYYKITLMEEFDDDPYEGPEKITIIGDEKEVTATKVFKRITPSFTPVYQYEEEIRA